MADEPDRLFERFRRSGDTEALGRVFDATAPRLLQIAVHLVGDLGAAEDLVQATFVTAIERADTFDASRNLESWLAGILANHARDLRKAARREIDVASLVERIEATPLQQALDAEWSSALAKALDNVPEPYRVVLILRLQHGMEPTAIAHALQRSPGAVRVQLHRGREMLRKLLPAGLVASALFIAEPSRGLVGVKASVITHAAVAKSSLGALAVIGGLLMSKKLAIAGAALLVALLAFLLVRNRMLEPQELSAAVSPKTATLETTAPEPAAITAVDGSPLAGRVDATSMTAAGTARTVTLHGRVLDSDTNAEIASADVSLFAPRNAPLFDVQRRWHDRLYTDECGVVRPFGSVWPVFASEPSVQACFDAEEVVVYEPPPEGVSPLAHTLTNSGGEFELTIPEALGFLVCRADGYGLRQQALSPAIVKLIPAFVNAADADAVSITIMMCASRSLAGYVVDDDMKRIEKRIRLAFFGPVKKSMAKMRPVDYQSDLWTFETNSDGSFECAVPAAMVYARSLEPDLGVVKKGFLRDGGTKWVDTVWPEPGHVSEPLVIMLKSVCSLVVRDRVTKAPIEDIYLECHRINGRVLRSGRFFAPSGRMRLANMDAVESTFPPQEDEMSRCECTVWAEGYLPAKQTLENLVAGHVAEFDLEPGELPAVTGRIHDAKRAVSSASVALLTLGQSTAWDPLSERVTRPIGATRPVGYQIARTTSDVTGAFRITGPRGRYVLDIVDGQNEVFRVVELPVTSPIDIDLSVDTAIVVSVHDTSGAACADQPVTLCGFDERVVRMQTDPLGIARFSRLPAGTHLVQVWNQKATRSKPDQEFHVDLRTAEVATVDVVIPVDTPRFARVLVEGMTQLIGWSACVGPSANPVWVGIETNGRAPIDIRGQPELRVAAPDHREWGAFLPKDAPDGYTIRIVLDGLGYEGVLTSQSTGEPLKAVRVHAVPMEDLTATVNVAVAVTDDEGRFRIAGLSDEAYSMYFDNPRSIEDLRWIYVHPATKPGNPLNHLAIALPKNGFGGTFEGLETIIVTGVIRNATGSPQGIQGGLGSFVERPGYTMRLYTGFRAGDDGRYEVRVPIAPSFGATLWKGLDPLEVLWKASGAGDREVHDIDLP